MTRFLLKKKHIYSIVIVLLLEYVSVCSLRSLPSLPADQPREERSHVYGDVGAGLHQCRNCFQ